MWVKQMSKDKRIEELFDRYFGDNNTYCPHCGKQIWIWTIPLLGEIEPEISDEPIYAPIEYFLNLDNTRHKCLKPRRV